MGDSYLEVLGRSLCLYYVQNYNGTYLGFTLITLHCLTCKQVAYFIFLINITDCKLETMLHHKHSALCTFLDLQGAFDCTTPTSIHKALQTHNTPLIIIFFILSTLTHTPLNISHIAVCKI